MSDESKSTIHSVCRLAVGVAVVVLVTHTWLVMGLVTPVTVAGSSMAPTLSGPRCIYLCHQCQRKFAVGIDCLATGAAICPECGVWTDIMELGTAGGDRLLVDRTAFAVRSPRRWEVVVFRSPVDRSELCVKRVVGLPGETVAIEGGGVRIDGKNVACPKNVRYELRPGDDPRLATGWRLGAGEYLVLGDNAAVSDDSRCWPGGPALNEKLLIGRPIGVR